MVRIEVTGEVITPSNPQRPRNQVIFVHTVGQDGKPRAYPDRAYLPLWRDDQPLSAGHYAPTPAAFYVNKFGNVDLSIGVKTLAPIKA